MTLPSRRKPRITVPITQATTRISRNVGKLLLAGALHLGWSEVGRVSAQDWSPVPFQPRIQEPQNPTSSHTFEREQTPSTFPPSTPRQSDHQAIDSRQRISDTAPSQPYLVPRSHGASTQSVTEAAQQPVLRWRKSSLAMDETIVNPLRASEAFESPDRRPNEALVRSQDFERPTRSEAKKPISNEVQLAQFTAPVQPPSISRQTSEFLEPQLLQSPPNTVTSPEVVSAPNSIRTRSSFASSQDFELGSTPSQDPTNQQLRDVPDLRTPPSFDAPSAQGTPREGSSRILSSEDDPPSPFRQDLPSPNPFPTRPMNQDISPRDLNNTQIPRNGTRVFEDCDSVREKALGRDISEVRLDTSPDIGIGVSSTDSSETRKRALAETAPIRSWYDYRGQFFVEGRIVDFSKQKVTIESRNGDRTQIRLIDLSDPDKTYVGEVWEIPVVCSTSNEHIGPREFVPSAVAWKASALCHKPLYFEDVQLERYGHEYGPVLQPALSTAHFFGNIIVLPYKMGIHPMNECQYSLGYYRPGSCAPWMLGPVPLSLRGAISEAGTIGLGFGVLP